MQGLGVQGQRRNTLLPGEPEISEHSRIKQAGLALGSRDNRRAHIGQICMHQQLSRQWQLAVQIGGYACATVIRAATACCCSPIVSPPAASLTIAGAGVAETTPW
jgi:hypothetical protein